jgi:hypothetical protein
MSTLSQNERKALNDIFNAITEKETFFSRFKETKNEWKHFVKLLFMRHKKRLKHPVR